MNSLTLSSDVLQSALHTLTKREWEVLVLLANDNSHSEISEKLGITLNTIKSYKLRIGEKLACSGHGSLARSARKNRDLLNSVYNNLENTTPQNGK